MFKSTVRLLILLSFFVSFRVMAAREAVVSIEGAMVYKGASFDSPVIAYLKKGKKVQVSNRNYGPFYRVRIRRGLVGYISDIDVKVRGGSKKSRRSSRKRRGSKRSRDNYGDYEDEDYDDRRRKKRRRDRYDDYDDEGDEYGDDSSDDEWSRTGDYKGRRKRKKPVFARTYIGANAGVVNFKEELFAQSLASNVMTLGAKMTGPNLLFEGPYIFDLNLNVAFSPPAYYTEIADAETAVSGMMAFIDALLIFPYSVPAHEKWALYFGAGPLVVYSSIQLEKDGTPFDLKELKLGASFMGGGSYEIYKDWIVKLEPKVFVEKNMYFGIFGSAQKEF